MKRKSKNSATLSTALKAAMRHNMACLLAPALVVASLGVSGNVFAQLDSRERVNFIHDRLTGVQATDAMLQAMENAANLKAAARLAIDGNANKGDAYQDVIVSSGGFYNNVVKNWASPWTNEAMDIFEPLNDYSATVIGFVRDDRDFSTLLSANTLYTGAANTYSNRDNAHYEALEASSVDLGNVNALRSRDQTTVTGTPFAGVAGVLTSRAAARAFYIDGTNRAMFRFTVLNHLCNDLEAYKDNALPTDRIRQDVSRSPGGDSSIYINECSACHTGMDPMTQAFAYHDFEYPTEAAAPGLTETERMDRGAMVYTPGSVRSKYFNNGGNFPPGYITPNDHWSNYWRTGPNAQKIGWGALPAAPPIDLAIDDVYAEGDGVASLGRELAGSDAFAYCQVKKAFKSICLREPQNADSVVVGGVDDIVADFKSGYDMKQAFIDIAVYCSGNPGL